VCSLTLILSHDSKCVVLLSSLVSPSSVLLQSPFCVCARATKASPWFKKGLPEEMHKDIPSYARLLCQSGGTRLLNVLLCCACSSAQSSSVLCISLSSLSLLSLSHHLCCASLSIFTLLPTCLLVCASLCSLAIMPPSPTPSPTHPVPAGPYMYVCIYIYTYIHIYIYMCVYIYVCVCVCVYIYLYTHKWHTYINGKNVRGGAQAS